MRYVCLGDRQTDPALRRQPCDPVRASPACVTGGRTLASVPAGLTRREIDDLGRRLRNDPMSAADRSLLERFRRAHDDPLASVADVLTGEFEATPGVKFGTRIKTVGTIIEKLVRQPELPLSQMQDIAGARIAADISREEQDAIAARVVELWPDHPRLRDRRAQPSHGYRAVHVIVKEQGCRVEIQIRTRYQNIWAQVMERIADEWGRQIRYGELPTDPEEAMSAVYPTTTRREIVANLIMLSELIAADEGMGAFMPPEVSANLSERMSGLARAFSA